MTQLSFQRHRLFALDKSDYVIFLIILLMSLIAISWFKGDNILNGVDADYPITPNADFERSVFAWWERGLGASNVRGLALAPLYTFPQLALNTIGLSLSSIQQLIFCLIVAFSGISMYLLMKKLVIRNRRFSSVASFISANFYMFNMFGLLFLYQPLLVPALYLYALLPMIFLFFTLSLDNKKYIAILGVLFFLVSPAANNPSFYAPLIILIVLYSFLSLITRRTKKNSLNILITAFLTFAVFILVNSFWILPVLTSLWQQYSVWLTGNSGAAINNYSNFSEMLRFLGWWAFSADYKGSPYFPYYPIYYTPTFVLLGFIIPIVAFLSLLISKRPNKLTLFFGLVSIIGLLLQKGEIEPFASFNTWFYTLPGSLAFDGPKFGALYTIAIAALLGTSLQFIFTKVSSLRSTKLAIVKVGTVVALFLIVINLFAWPFWTGDLYSVGDGFPPRQISIPSYYTEIAEYLNNQPGVFRVLGLPSYEGVPSLWVPYTWGYLGVDPLWHYLSQSYIIPNYFQGGINSYLYQLSVQNDFSELINFASLLNVKYIILRGDVDHKFYTGCASPDKVNTLLQDQPELIHVGQFGELNLYEVNTDNISPWVYTSSNAIIAENNKLLPLVATGALDYSSSVLIEPATLSSLDDLELNIIRYETIDVSIPVLDGRINPIDWSSISIDNYVARNYLGWKGIISVTGTGDSDMLIFDSPDECPYTFPKIEDKYWWSGYHSTIVYLKTGNSPLILNSVSASGTDLPVVGVWWESGWMGMGTRSIIYPIVLPPNQRVIIQIDQLMNSNIILNYSPIDSLPISVDVLPKLNFQRINPVEYLVDIEDATEPFFLVLSESYDSLWTARISEQQVDDKYHFMINSYSNAWYINPKLYSTDDHFTVTLYYAPQNLFYVGLAISIISVTVCCAGYFVFSYKKFRRT
jgi:hypothetical protein